MGWLLYLILGHGSAPSGGALPEHSQNVSHVQEAVVIGKPKQTAEWLVTPTIRICASSEVSVYRTSRASRYWEARGYSFDGIFVDSSAQCMIPRYGEIMVAIPSGGFSDHHMASTRLYTSKKTGEILKAKIHILPSNSRKDRVLEHELGHALGWSHYPQRYHIMHPTWKDGGYDSYGVHKK